MARLQILELPEGSGDDRPPFVLVVDEVSYPTVEAHQTADAWWQHLAQQVGARGCIVTDDTIDIPANDTTAYLRETEERAEPDRIYERAIQAEEKLKAFMDKRYAIEQGRKISLLDALGMDRTRDWDDILNAAHGIRNERDAQAAELERLHAGEEPVTDERVTPTPAQWIWHWNRATPEKRLDMAAQIIAGMRRSSDCLMSDHEAQIAHLRREIDQLRGTSANPDA